MTERVAAAAAAAAADAATIDGGTKSLYDGSGDECVGEPASFNGERDRDAPRDITARVAGRAMPSLPDSLS